MTVSGEHEHKCGHELEAALIVRVRCKIATPGSSSIFGPLNRRNPFSQFLQRPTEMGAPPLLRSSPRPFQRRSSAHSLIQPRIQQSLLPSSHHHFPVFLGIALQPFVICSQPISA
ncbi:unnamed protein product [Cercopithifilaria johnstoni]|uniref:Uncharacterized protein n=1 Tax=Cercopithifilaria johnstoni TaxID=2874296 RepID=A0A8J2M6E6_9BILA|nr:unnamed protein product [Cercopithifilaria johnstoni]